MKKLMYCLLMLTVLCALPSSLAASTLKGKVYYSKVLKPACGFNGNVMGKKHTMNEWKHFYQNNQLSLAIQVLCPHAPEISDPNDLLNLYHFLSSFASDSGNVPSCN
ncbi:hypothetical protein [Sulfurospirillum deleyianum]|uniref:Cytochrome C n=1 Tax=Sulfurospirillum deleyianum (strain ATCC 51133 / DSM 6946 / 5175) TaxID=525898 RepID=D1AZ26_SULD5|nr:hypothetical protein [Sulfurospirillum deleyianum]ACZ11164.1 conserved hypothetical protein [Sulfurospirillum deleyianum DSM 6946]